MGKIERQFLDILHYMHESMNAFDVAILFVIGNIVVIAFLFYKHDEEEDLKDDDNYELI